MPPSLDVNRWPALPYAGWKDTRDTLHLWTQIVGKIRLMQAPWLNHSWHVVLYVTARGLTTSPVPYRERAFQIDFDFIDHVLWVRTSDGQFRKLALAPMPVAEFYAELFAAMAELGLDVRITMMPCEIADAIPFDQDRTHAAYDRDYVTRFWRVLLSTHQVLTRFRTGFLGKTSPVHFFWGSFDLAVTRFSGRRAPRHPGRVPHLPNAVVREAYSHEVSRPASGRAAAGRWNMPRSIPMPIRRRRALPPPPCARNGLSSPRSSANSSCVRRRADGVGSRAGADGIFAEHVRGRGESRALGSCRIGMRPGGSRPTAMGLARRAVSFVAG
jgi:hypothetical protein